MHLSQQQVTRQCRYIIEVWWAIQQLLYYGFIAEFAGEIFFKSVNIWRSYRQEVADRPLIICKSILLQYLFLCIAAQQMHTVILWEFQYDHSVYLLVSELNNPKMTVRNFNNCSEWLSLVLHHMTACFIDSGLEHGNFLNSDISQASVVTQFRCGGGN